MLSLANAFNEEDLIIALKNKKISGAAIDVFSEEPYKGKLLSLDNCLLTPHISPMTIKARESMELSAANNIIKYLTP